MERIHISKIKCSFSLHEVNSSLDRQKTTQYEHLNHTASDTLCFGPSALSLFRVPPNHHPHGILISKLQSRKVSVPFVIQRNRQSPVPPNWQPTRPPSCLLAPNHVIPDPPPFSADLIELAISPLPAHKRCCLSKQQQQQQLPDDSPSPRLELVRHQQQ